MFKGTIKIYSEVCCELCGEIIHNHLDCPVCNTKNASSDNYGSLADDFDYKDGAKNKTILICEECKSEFETESYPYAYDAVWTQIK